MGSLVRVINRFTSSKGPKILFAKIEINHLRPISSKLIRSTETDRPPKPKPWNYNEKPFRTINRLFDKTTARFDENSKVSHSHFYLYNNFNFVDNCC